MKWIPDAVEVLFVHVLGIMYKAFRCLEAVDKILKYDLLIEEAERLLSGSEQHLSCLRMSRKRHHFLYDRSVLTIRLICTSVKR